MIKEAIKIVYTELKNRDIHPSGTFDNGGRFYAEHDDLIDVRSPSRAWPYSHMQACRTLKYVKAVCEKFECETYDDIIKFI
ncbi:MAG: hypothetical protein QNK36_15095 [Colwellia sp.]|nr:hypothetical protein [Colwellia sp.]